MLYHATPYRDVPDEPPRSASERIRIGYGGHINYRLLDGWLDAVLQQPDMELHMIGKEEKQYMRRWAGRTRMILHTNLSDGEFLDTLRAMDVLIMPYNTEIPEVAIMTTNSKTFQYMAAGRPMVISNMPHYIDLPTGAIYRAVSEQDFVAKIRQAYAEDCAELVRLRLAIARQNTWDHRGDMLRSIIESDLGASLVRTGQHLST